MDPYYGYKEMNIDDYYKVSTNKYILLQPKNILGKYTPSSFINSINRTLFNNIKPLISIFVLNLIYLLLSLLLSFYIVILKEYMNILCVLLFMILIIIINLISYIIVKCPLCLFLHKGHKLILQLQHI